MEKWGWLPKTLKNQACSGVASCDPGHAGKEGGGGGDDAKLLRQRSCDFSPETPRLGNIYTHH